MAGYPKGCPAFFCVYECQGAWRAYAFAPLPYRQEGLPVPGQTWLASLTPPNNSPGLAARHYDTIISLYSL